MRKRFDKFATLICFIGLASPLWLGLLIIIACEAYAPGFGREPMQPDTTEFYRTLPDRIKQKSDSLNLFNNAVLKTNLNKIDRN